MPELDIETIDAWDRWFLLEFLIATYKIIPIRD